MIRSDRFFIWTDFGGVLTPPIEGAMATFCIARGIKPADLKQALEVIACRHGVADPMELIDRPVMPEAKWLFELNALLCGRLPDETLADAWFDERPANADWIEVLTEQKRAGHGIGLLSNMVPTWDTHWRRMVDVEALFDEVLLSFEVHARKPEALIFELATERAGVPAERCILVDDLAVNCQGAERAGWHSVHFETFGQAAERLRDLLKTHQPTLVASQ